MGDYHIGIIDEDIDEIAYIERTIIINRPDDIGEDQIEFYAYPLTDSADTLSERISDSAISDVIAGKIDALIIDYKIIVKEALVEGAEIFKSLSAEIPKFPTVILTNVPEACYGKEFVDADKVYAKRSFFKVEGSYSKEKTLNIFRNMDNYRSQRAMLSTQLNEQLDKLTVKGYSVETIQNIVEIEKSLDDFCPQQQTIVEKSLNISELKNAVDLIQEAKSFLGEEDED